MLQTDGEVSEEQMDKVRDTVMSNNVSPYRKIDLISINASFRIEQLMMNFDTITPQEAITTCDDTKEVPASPAP